jgi:hypothetical protein
MKGMSTLFMINNEAQLKQFIEQNHLKDNVGWEINPDDKRVYFRAEVKE